MKIFALPSSTTHTSLIYLYALPMNRSRALLFASPTNRNGGSLKLEVLAEPVAGIVKESIGRQPFESFGAGAKGSIFIRFAIHTTSTGMLTDYRD